MEGAAHARQRLAVGRVLLPEREQAADGRDLLARLLDEEREELRVDRRAPLGGIRRAVRGRRRRPRRRRSAAGAACAVAGAAPRSPVERHQAALGVVEHVPGIAAAGLQRLHVVLDADDRVREAVDVLVVAREAARAEQRRDVVADAAHHLHRAVAAEQQEARGDAARERGRRIEADRSAVGSSDWPSSSLMRARFTMHSRSTVSVTWRNSGSVSAPGAGAPRRHDQPHERVVEAVLDADQRRRDRDQRVLLGRRAARDDVRQARELALHLLAHRAEAEHGERVADLLSRSTCGASSSGGPPLRV